VIALEAIRLQLLASNVVGVQTALMTMHCSLPAANEQGGAGATLGAARIIAGLQPPGPEIHFIVASCENMVNGHGLRPGDVLTSAAGTSAWIGRWPLVVAWQRALWTGKSMFRKQN
jgi:hypothetical protein